MKALIIGTLALFGSYLGTGGGTPYSPATVMDLSPSVRVNTTPNYVQRRHYVQARFYGAKPQRYGNGEHGTGFLVSSCINAGRCHVVEVPARFAPIRSPANPQNVQR